MGAVGLALSWPLMMISRFALAAMRGEVRKVWAYKQDWHESGPSSLEDGMTTKDNLAI